MTGAEALVLLNAGSNPMTWGVRDSHRSVLNESMSAGEAREFVRQMVLNFLPTDELPEVFAKRVLQVTQNRQNPRPIRFVAPGQFECPVAAPLPEPAGLFTTLPAGSTPSSILGTASSPLALQQRQLQGMLGNAGYDATYGLAAQQASINYQQQQSLADQLQNATRSYQQWLQSLDAMPIPALGLNGTALHPPTATQVREAILGNIPAKLQAAIEPKSDPEPEPPKPDPAAKDFCLRRPGPTFKLKP